MLRQRLKERHHHLYTRGQLKGKWTQLGKESQVIVIEDNEQGGGSKSKCEAQKKSDDQKEAGSEK